MSASDTCALRQIAVIPRPTIAGVFGMVRTMGVLAPRDASNAAMVVPAAIDMNSVFPFPSACSAGSAAPIICGFTASSATAGAGGRPSFRWTPVRISQSVGLGSITQTESGGTPAPSHPVKSAVPILPQPSSTSPSRTTRSNVMDTPFARGQG